MVKKFKKSGQKITRKLSRFSQKAAQDSKEHVKTKLIDRISHAKTVRLLILEWILLVSAITLLAITQSLWYNESHSLSTYQSGGTYVEATLGKINSLNPLFATTNSEKALSRLLFATLTKTDYSGHTGFGLAESITTDSEGKTWTIKLRDHLKWSDGEPLTNTDVLFTVNLIKNPNIKTSYAANLAGVSVTEESGKIIFHLPSAYANFPSSLNLPILPEHILKDTNPKQLLESDFNFDPISSGPFSFNANQPTAIEDETIVYLSANPYYYNGTPLIKNFAVHAFVSRENIISALKAGSVTATAELSSTDQLASSTIYEKQTAINSGVFIFMNTASPVLQNHTLRRAIQQGINVSDLRVLFSDTAALDYPILPSQIDLDDYPALPKFDFEAAKTATAQAEFDREATLSIATVTTDNFPALAERFAEQLRALGLKVEVETYEPSQEFIRGVVSTRAYDFLIYEIELGTDPDLLAYYHSSQASTVGLNLSNYKNSLMDDLLVAARSTMDVTLRKTKYQAILRQWVNDAPAIGVVQPNLTYYYNKNVRPFLDDSRLSTPIDRFNDVEYWGAEKTQKNRTP